MSTPDATVLVVEDEDSFVDALTVGLKREGFRVVVARDGAEALDVFDAVRPDLVLLDVMLPKVSGIDVCRELRRRSSVPIIMVTAKGSEIDTVVGLEVGADDYVTKPYRLRELVARMRAVLRRRAGDAPRTRPRRRRAGGRRRGPRPRAARGGDPRRAGLAPAQGVRAARAPARQRRAGPAPRHPDRPGVGHRTTWATPRPSTSTSSGCGPRWSPIRRHRPGSSPSGAWATSTRCRRA